MTTPHISTEDGTPLRMYQIARSEDCTGRPGETEASHLELSECFWEEPENIYCYSLVAASKLNFIGIIDEKPNKCL